MSSPPKKSDTETSFAALNSPAYDPKAAAKKEREKKKQKSDFGTLKRELGDDYVRRPQGPTATDYIIDGFVPFLIYCMVTSVAFFMLDVRFIFSAREHVSLRLFTFFIFIGIVALNRLVARDNTGEAWGYAIVFAGMVAMYTVLTTGAYGVGSFAGGFFDTPGWSLAFNITAIVLAWWVANRLVHECSVDENRSAGDIGILTGTLRDLRQSMQRSGEPAAKKSWKDEVLLPSIEIEAYDPNDWKETEKKKAPPKKATERLGRRHPGVSIFYFAAPVMLIFTLGLPVLLRGGGPFVLAGHVYVATFTLCALTLLLLTSLGGLREYFRARRVPLPAGLGWFWAGLGGFMVLAVALGALQLPMPRMPAPAYVAEHEIDPWSSIGERFELTPAAAGVADSVQQSQVIERTSQFVLALLILFALYSALRGVTIVAAEIGKRRDRYPRWVVRLFDWLDRILERIVSLPEIRHKLTRGRPSAANAASTKFRNPMAGEGAEGKGEDVQRYLAHAFDAICALGDDLGRPRRRDETPYEYLRHLPRELTPLKRESAEVVEWYVRSAYSKMPPDATILDRLRKFWFEYERLRRRYIR